MTQHSSADPGYATLDLYNPFDSTAAVSRHPLWTTNPRGSSSRMRMLIFILGLREAAAGTVDPIHAI